ncbi:hypothetical protein [Mesorhizobium amorphae]|uniref:hypothetical protein n=1 Tax=Mesorhizobium amorphae TaxID=71433 RepID=UPI0017871D4C|nr:hypothetical protein [Mesorhizobium amorphae]
MQAGNLLRSESARIPLSAAAGEYAVVLPIRAMTADQLPDDPDALKAMVMARDVENARHHQRAETLPEEAADRPRSVTAQLQGSKLAVAAAPASAEGAPTL